MLPRIQKFRLRLWSAALLLAISLSSQSQAQETTVKARHTLAILAGSFAVKTNSGQLSSIGALNLAYQFHISPEIGVAAVFNQGLSASSGGASIFTGFDIGGTYCLFSCVQTRQNFDNALLLDKTPKFGIDLGIYISQRSFQLSSKTVAYTGFAGRVTLGYYLFQDLRLLLVGSYAQLKNFDVTVTESQLLGGVSFDFDF